MRERMTTTEMVRKLLEEAEYARASEDPHDEARWRAIADRLEALERVAREGWEANRGDGTLLGPEDWAAAFNRGAASAYKRVLDALEPTE